MKPDEASCLLSSHQKYVTYRPYTGGLRDSLKTTRPGHNCHQSEPSQNNIAVENANYLNLLSLSVNMPCCTAEASTEREVDATCVQFGSRGKRIPPSRGEEFPEIYGVILMIVL